MSDPQDQNNQTDLSQNNQGSKKQDQNKKPSSPPIKIYISPPVGGKPVVNATGKEGEFNILISLGQNRTPAKDTVAVKVFANDEQIGSVQHVKNPTNYAIDNVKLNTSDEVIFSVKQIGQEKPDDQLTPINLLKVKTVEAPKTPQRFDVIVGSLTSNKVNPVTFVTHDENLRRAKGTVVFSLGQSAKIDGTTVGKDKTSTIETSDGSAGNSPLGMRSMAIKLNREDATISFHHLESGEEVLVSLLFEP